MQEGTVRRRKGLAVALGLLTVVVVTYSAALSGTALAPVDVAFLVALLSAVFGGVYLVLRRPENPVGLLLVGFGASFTLGSSADVIAVSESPMAPWSAWLSTWQWAVGLVLLLIVLPLLFPEGHLPSTRYRWVIPTALVGLALTILGNAFRPTTTIDGETGEVVVDLPLTLPLSPETFDALASAGTLLMVVALVAAVTGVVRRFRHSTGVERQQMRVFGAGLIGSVALVGVNLFLIPVGQVVVANILFSLAVVVLIASIAVAVLRYRLYDLGTVISRTITYSIVAVLVAGAYGVGAVWLPTELVGEQSPVFVAGSTLLVAALFNPTRKRVMRLVDRRFNRMRYDAERILDEFAVSLQVRRPSDEIVAGWLGVVSETMHPASAGVWMRSNGIGRPGPGMVAGSSTSVATHPER